MSIDVVLVRARDQGPQANHALATAIAGRYGVPLEALLARLAVGNFAVKSKTDRETASRYLRDLEAMGAICELRDSATGRVLEQAAPDQPAGLAAASGAFSQDLGALAGGNFALSTLDGKTGDTEPPPIAGAPLSEPYNLQTPPAGMPALPEPALPERAAFAPPPPAAKEEELMLAVDPRAPAPGYQADDAPPPPKTMAPEGYTGGARILSTTPTPEKKRGPGIGEMLSGAIGSARHGLASRSRGAFVCGVAAALLGGFLAANVVAVFQESSAYAPVRKELLVSYGEATDPESHAALPSLRAGAIDLIESRQRKIAITAMLVWLISAAGVAALWFRVIRWEALAPPIRAAADPAAARPS